MEEEHDEEKDHMIGPDLRNVDLLPALRRHVDLNLRDAGREFPHAL